MAITYAVAMMVAERPIEPMPRYHWKLANTNDSPTTWECIEDIPQDMRMMARKQLTPGSLREQTVYRNALICWDKKVYRRWYNALRADYIHLSDKQFDALLIHVESAFTSRDAQAEALEWIVPMCEDYKDS
jgi:hypothetical protein